MRIEFWLRTPGNHTRHSSVDWDVVPREGEQVEISKDDVREVHSVEWQLPGVVGGHKTGSVKILLR